MEEKIARCEAEKEQAARADTQLPRPEEVGMRDGKIVIVWPITEETKAFARRAAAVLAETERGKA